MGMTSRRLYSHLNVPLFQTALDQIYLIQRSPNRVGPVPIRRGAVVLLLLVRVDIVDDGGFNVGHHELMGDWKKEERNGWGE